MPSPAQLDPTRTATLRRQFATQTAQRLRQIVQQVRQYSPAQATTADPHALQGLNGWLQGVATQALLEPHRPPQRRWLAQWVLRAYMQGQALAFDDVRGVERYIGGKQPAARYKAAKEEFLNGALASQQHKERVQLLIFRMETELASLANDISTRIVRAYAETLTLNWSKKALASFAEQLDVSIKKAELIAQTEILRAHAEGILDAYERLDVGKVKVLVEWTTAGDGKVCSKCKALEGIALTIAEARGLFPRHPRCRCSPRAYDYKGRMSDKLAKGRRKRIEAVRKSIELEKPKSGKRRKVGRPKTSAWSKRAKKQIGKRLR